MRESVGSLADWANVTWPANANATLSISLQFVVSLTGLPTNLLVLYISFFGEGINGNYKYFLANLAVCDLFSSCSTLFQLCFHLYHLLRDVPLNVTRCYIQSFTPYMFGFLMGATLPLASINRYCVICLDKEHWFTGKNIALLCAFAYFPILYPIIDVLFANQVVAYCDLCSFNIFTPNNPEWILIALVPYVYPTLIFCNVSVYKKLSQHMNTTQRLLGKDMQNEKSILKALVIQAAIPPILSTPIGIMLGIIWRNGFDQVPILHKVIIRFGENAMLTILDIGFITFDFNQVLDPLVTLIVVKPYWAATKVIFHQLKRRFFGEHNTISSL